MIILGIDPGIGRTGWGVVTREKGELRSEKYGCIETPAGMGMPERLEMLYTELVEILRLYQPQDVAVEELFFNTNVTTAISVGQARGVILLAAQQAKLPLAVYTPLQVKMALTGYGRADKKQIGDMIKLILKLPAVPKPDDTSDALAIAITHAFSLKLKLDNR
jgi:crossover junction endodeoxyribonuclease RuvC